MRTPRASSRGFTLIELLVVVVLLALVASMATVASTDDDTLALDMAAMQITDAVERAHALALSTRTAHAVTFDVTNDRFAVVDEFGALLDHPVSKKPWLVDFVSPEQPQRIDLVSASFGDAGEAIMFDAAGEGVESGTLELGRGDVTVTLSFNAATGRIE